MEGINTPFVIDEHTAIVMTDPQNDFLSENGLGWGAFGENIQKNGTVENLRRIFEVAAAKGMLVFISPHYYYKHDHQWLFEGPIEKLMHDTGMFERRGQLTGEGFDVSADYRPEQLIETVAAIPLAFEPGTDVKQSATNFLLLTSIIEKAGKMPYHDFVKAFF